MEKKPNFIKFVKQVRSSWFIGEDRVSYLKNRMFSFSVMASNKIKDFKFIDVFIDKDMNIIKFVEGTNFRIIKNGNNRYIYCKGTGLPKGNYYAENDYYVLKK